MPGPQKLLAPSPSLGKKGKKESEATSQRVYNSKRQGLSNSLNIELKKLTFRSQLRRDFLREACSAAQPPGYCVPLLLCYVSTLPLRLLKVPVDLRTSLLTPHQAACSERRGLHRIYSLINI